MHHDNLGEPPHTAITPPPTIQPTFPIGLIVATETALFALERTGESPGAFVTRHAQRDWGELDEHDWAANDLAVDHADRLLSAYRLTDGTRLWVITESDRTVTTILLPEDY